MADLGYILSLLQGLDPRDRRVLQAIFEHVLSSIAVGAPEHGRRAQNWLAVCYTATTPSVPDQPLTITHDLGRTPRVAVPILPLVPGASLVPLRVPQAPDSRQLYLASSVAGAPVSILVE